MRTNIVAKPLFTPQFPHLSSSSSVKPCLPMNRVTQLFYTKNLIFTMEARNVAIYILGLIIPVKMAEFSVPPSNDAS